MARLIPPFHPFSSTRPHDTNRAWFIIGGVIFTTLIFVGFILFFYGIPTTYEALGGMATAVMALGGLLSLFVLAASWLDQSLHQKSIQIHQTQHSILSFQKLIYDLQREWIEDEHRKLDDQWKSVFYKNGKASPCFKAMMEAKKRLRFVVECHSKAHNLAISIDHDNDDSNILKDNTKSSTITPTGRYQQT
jgi:hypothetical protein